MVLAGTFGGVLGMDMSIGTGASWGAGAESEDATEASSTGMGEYGGCVDR